jgi:hypothetical protein
LHHAVELLIEEKDISIERAAQPTALLIRINTDNVAAEEQPNGASRHDLARCESG